MKKVVLFLATLCYGLSYGQEIPEVDITTKNSWFKAGLTAGVPMGDAKDISSFNVGVDVRGQYLFNPHFGIGIASGYNHFFGKNEVDFLTVSINLFASSAFPVYDPMAWITF